MANFFQPHDSSRKNVKNQMRVAPEEDFLAPVVSVISLK